MINSNDQFYLFEKIYIEKKFKNHKNTKNILSRIKNNPVIIIIDDINKLIKELPVIYNPSNRSKYLLLCGIRGEILQKCPGSHGHLCCNYNVINLYVGCPLNCTYCILQSYLNQPFTIINIDIESIFFELDKIFTSNPDKFYRIGTGELGDSLVYDPITDYSIDFINFFSKYDNVIFEFKTKTNFIGNIIKTGISKNIVIGFSVNPQIIIDSEEYYSNSLIERLQAANELIINDYKISLHFDPIINICNFDEEYKNLIDTIFDYVDPKKISWISLGTFRYTPQLKNMIEYNYPESKLLNEEFIECEDKKYRYFKPIRLNLYNKIINWLNDKSNDLPIYLCMESPYTWNNTLGFLPYKKEKINLIF